MDFNRHNMNRASPLPSGEGAYGVLIEGLYHANLQARLVLLAGNLFQLLGLDHLPVKACFLAALAVGNAHQC